MALKKVREAVVDALIRERIGFVFGMPGGQSCEVLYDALYEKDDIKAILSRDERAGAFMAAGSSQVTRGPAVASGTLGPGFSNMLTGLCEAWLGSWPIIFIAPGAPTMSSGRPAAQEIPQCEMVRSVTKFSFRLDNPSKTPYLMRRAISEACSGKPGPVFIEIPTDMGGFDAEMPDYVPPPRIRNFEPSSDEVCKAAELILKSERPVLIAGSGVHWSMAWNELQEFVELLGIPVLTTSSGKGSISDNHPLACGMMGQWGSRFSNELPEDADAIIWMGSQIEEYDTVSWTRGAPTNAKFIYANIDPNHASDQWIPDVALIGDSKLTLRKLIAVCKEKLRTMNRTDFSRMPRIERLLQLKKEFLDLVRSDEMSDATPIHPARMIREIDRAMPKDCIVCSDAGMFAAWVVGYPGITISKPGHFIYNGGGTAIGQSVALGIGAQLSTSEQVVSIVGDGGFQQYMMEMATAAQYHAPLVVFISNNQSIAWIAHWQREIHQERYVATFFEPQVDFSKIAEAQKCRGIRIERPSELKTKVEEAFKAAKNGTPVVVDVLTDWSAKHHGPTDVMNVFKQGRYPLPGVR